MLFILFLNFNYRKNFKIIVNENRSEHFETFNCFIIKKTEASTWLHIFSSDQKIFIKQ